MDLNMKCDKLFETVDRLLDEHLDILEDVCKIESPTDYKEGVDRVGEYFIKYAEKKGWQVEVCEQKVAGNAVCITVNPNAKKAPIAVSGHMDTVHPVGSFKSPIVRREDGRMYGPGTVDCKGGIVCSLLAINALCECGFSDRPILLILQSDEEKSSIPSGKETIRFMCEKAKDAEAFLNADGGYPDSAVLIRKGIMRLKLTVHGKAAHSALCYNGASAIAEAAHKIIELEKMKDKQGLTCNCGMISGGSAPNVVADKCEFIADIRFATIEEKERAYAEACRLAEHSIIEGCTCEVTEVSYRPPMEYSEKNENLLKRMNEIYTENGLPEIKGITANGGSDAAYTTISGIPTVDSTGVWGGFTHNPGEFIYMDSVATAAKRIAAVIYCI